MAQHSARFSFYARYVRNLNMYSRGQYKMERTSGDLGSAIRTSGARGLKWRHAALVSRRLHSHNQCAGGHDTSLHCSQLMLFITSR